MTTDSKRHHGEQVETVRWMVRLGAVTADALAEREGCSTASARGRLQAAARAGFAGRARPLHGAPSLYTATRAGMTLVGLRGEEPSRVCAASARHQIACARAAVVLERHYPHHLVLGERELQRAERAVGGRLACARTSWRSRWGAWHRPDLVLWPAAADAAPVAVEVELTAKAPARLYEICRAWGRCRNVAGVLYLASPAAFSPVARAIRAAGAEDRIALLGLEALDGIAPSAAHTASGAAPASAVTGTA